MSETARKRLVVLQEALSWLTFLAIGDLLLFGEGLSTAAMIYLIGLPGSILYAAWFDLEDRPRAANARACVQRFVLLLIPYNVLALLLLQAITDFNVFSPPIAWLFGGELLLIAIGLLPAYLSTKTWPPPNLVLFFCEPANPDDMEE